MNRVHRRFYLETGLALISGICAIITLIWPTWIELVLRLDPDHATSVLEWCLIGVLSIVACICILLARMTWRQVQAVH